MSSPVSTVTNVLIENIANRSPMQQLILNYLATTGQPIGDRIGHLPRTGDIVDSVSRQRDKSGFASVSRSLRRLAAAGVIVAYSPYFYTKGKGLHWALSKTGEVTT